VCRKRLSAVRAGRSHIAPMVKITITPEAFAALAATLPIGSVAVEPERAPDGGVGIWLDHATVAKLRAIRGPGDSYSDAIIALAEAHAGRSSRAKTDRGQGRSFGAIQAPVSESAPEAIQMRLSARLQHRLRL
jgi:hypothetical protein